MRLNYCISDLVVNTEFGFNSPGFGSQRCYLIPLMSLENTLIFLFPPCFHLQNENKKW